jgi:hypothetical protein
MSAKTNYLEDAILNHVLRNNALTSPAAVYAGLLTAAPGEAGGGTEVSGGSYARQAVTFGAPSSNQCANSVAVEFPVASGAWGTVTHFAIYDAASGGNMLYYGSLGASKVIASGDQFKFAIGALVVGED